MRSLTKKAICAAGVFLAASISNVYGNYIVSYGDLENPVPYDNYSSPVYSYPNYEVSYNSNNVVCCPTYTPAPSACSSCDQLFLNADFLYWRVYEEGVDVCVPSSSSDTTFPDGRIISLFEGRDQDPNFTWSPGVRVTGGYEFSNHWAVALAWTYLNSHAKSSNNHSHHLNWHVNLNLLDVLTSYSYNCSKCFTLRPFIGIRAAWIDQKLRVGVTPTSTTFAGLGEAVLGINNKQDFSGVGPFIGLGGDLQVGKGFGVYVNASVAWIYGHSNLKLIDSLATFDVIDHSYVKKHLDPILTVVDFAFGINWQKSYCGFFYSLNLGFEHHQFYDYNRFNDSGDLSFDGIVCGLGIGF